MRSAPLTAKILLAFAIPLIAFLSIAGLSLSTLDSVAMTSEWSNHTVRVLGAAFSLESMIVKLEEDAHAASPIALKDFEDTKSAFISDGESLRELVADNPSQVERVVKLLDEFKTWSASYTDLSPSGSLHDRIATFRKVERGLLNTRTEQSTRTIARARDIITWAAVFSVITASVAGVLLSRSIVTAVHWLTEASSEVARGNFKARAHVGHNDEVGQLAVTFNTMAAALERRTQDFGRLRTMGDTLQACGTSLEAAEVIARIAPPLFGTSRHVEIFELNPSRNLVTRLVAWGDRSKEIDLLPGPFAPEDCWALRRGRPHVVSNAATDVCCSHLQAITDSYSCLPLLAQGEVIGAIHIEGTLDAETERMTNAVGDQLGLTLGNIRLRERLRNQSIRDPLTGLFNRRYFEETLQRELSRAARNKQPLGVMMLDVDHFKTFNDEHGHQVGDEILRQLAELLQAEFRASDFACRYGGEEFVVVLLDADVEATTKRAEMLRVKVKALSSPTKNVSASIGVAAFPVDGADGASLVRAADQAMYRAKAGGRNRVECGLPPIVI